MWKYCSRQLRLVQSFALRPVMIVSAPDASIRRVRVRQASPQRVFGPSDAERPRRSLFPKYGNGHCHGAGNELTLAAWRSRSRRSRQAVAQDRLGRGVGR